MGVAVFLIGGDCQWCNIEFVYVCLCVSEVLWETSLTKNDHDPEAVLSFLNLKAKTEYQFRVMAFNQARGISVPSEPSEFIETLGQSLNPANICNTFT